MIRIVADTQPALCVDLDGTLVATDMLWESLLALVRNRPWEIFRVPGWLLQGKAAFKRRVAEIAPIDPAALPYRQEVLRVIQRYRREGRQVFLATATDQSLAAPISRHLGLFDGVIASDGQRNASGTTKLEMIRRQLGKRPFEYMGDSARDLPLWQSAAKAYVVASSPRLVRQAAGRCPDYQVLAGPPNHWRDAVRALRPYQWIKNTLVFVPLIMAHELHDGHKLLAALLCFIAFCLCASGIYVLNDLLDLEADRQHPVKRNRPLAAGRLSIPAGLGLMAAALTGSFVLCLAALPLAVLGMLLIYAAVSMLYSLGLKRKLMLDVLCLAGLYAHRIWTGGIATAIAVSPWLLAFSGFLFLSLAFVKRYAELAAHQARPKMWLRGRGYRAEDLELLRTVGPASGYIAVLVLCLYINLSPEVTHHYRHPQALYLICPLVLYWISRIWFLAQRRQLSEDPVVFAIHDRTSLLTGLATAAVLAAAWVPIP